ncbi:hypothetical protein Gasu2_68780 [Galdieria sulphuraria]|uniref:Uncharacterized protein n=1 Tax=Galdieria sulphuraria TaxID=130081 RepID=M2XHN4_GALSU|nr:uncharacterized protein Gasu_30360 [Galdieria sulphuraria]EME29597.1 hypothetical protein Gasu_30360 [Galdieria sulphuraria]GJD12808.1 hypothetical protein Gasu2_68780 [Galdieria sulphuraria]|eukprot:XP_005706117.1 hypothetical protein Gasu_30360 [Galdieria sulphuraria]
MDQAGSFVCIIFLAALTFLETSSYVCGEYLINMTNFTLEYTSVPNLTVQHEASIPGLFLGLANYGDHRIKQTILYESGKLNPAFTCSNASENSCYVVDKFQDRSLFYFEFQASYNYYPRVPKIESQTLSVLLQEGPTLEAEDLRDSLRKGMFTLFYGCPRAATIPSTHLIKVNVPLGQPGSNLSFSFLKECGCGSHPYAYLVLQDDRGEEVNEKSVVLDPMVSTFQLSVVLNYGEAVQSFDTPKLIYDHDVYNLQISGQGADRGGIVLGGEKVTWLLQDECIGSLDGTPRLATVFVPIPPFEPLSIQFSKDCGGGRPRGLFVGFTSSSSEIVKDGIVQLSPFTLLNETDKFLELYLSLQGETSPRSMMVGPPILDIVDPSVVSGKLISDMKTQHSLNLYEDLLKVGDQKPVTFSFICKRTGQTIVDISVPIRNRDKIHMQLVKRCKAPSAFRNSTYLTASNITFILITLFAFVLGVCAVRKLRPQKN